MKKHIFIIAFATFVAFGCNNSDSGEHTSVVDSPVTNLASRPDDPPHTEENPCNITIDPPTICNQSCEGEDCQKAIAKLHKIEYPIFRRAIEKYSHRPSSKINRATVVERLSAHSCTEWRILLDGDHVNKKNTNDDITIVAEEYHGAKAYYELAVFKGLILLGAQEIYFYKGESQKGGANCYDIFIEVKYSADSFVCYDLSDSEEAISSHK